VVFSGGNFLFLGNITELQTLTEIQIFRKFSLFFLVKVASLFDIDSILQVYVFFLISFSFLQNLFVCLFVCLFCFDFALIFLFLAYFKIIHCNTAYAEKITTHRNTFIKMTTKNRFLKVCLHTHM